MKDFNMQTLNHYLNSDDEFEKSLAEDVKDDFAKYTKIVLTFDDKMNVWREEKSGEDYRRNVSKLDKDRRLLHDNCLHDIDIINRMAKADGIEPFADFDVKNTNRRDIGDLILEQHYENMQNDALQINNDEYEQKPKSKHHQNRDIMDNYNFSLVFTKYPLVEKDGMYSFIDIFTQDTVEPKAVKTYILNRTNDIDVLKSFDKACDLANSDVNLNFDGLNDVQAQIVN